MKKKGFTLIELMIVLAIVAILAVVLVPKAGIFKSQARNSGVLTNVTAVRAYLEAKTGKSFIGGTGADAATAEANGITNVIAALNSAFPSSDTDNKIENPFDTTKNTATGTVPGSAGYGPNILVDDAEPADLKYVKGSVVVIYDLPTETYTIFGVDNGGAKVGEVTIKK